MKIVAVIPARLASTRFPRKVLLPIEGLPMVEHVRRRGLLSSGLDDVVVATCDDEIAAYVRSQGGKAVMTSNRHENGTSRVAEAIKGVECSHVILLQGDEPLLLPRHIEQLVMAMTAAPEIPAWNLVAELNDADELHRHSFVKCTVGVDARILYCFRRSPGCSDYSIQKIFTRKMLGIIAFRKDFLLTLSGTAATPIEKAESIEQMRIIESGHRLAYLAVTPSLPSINEPDELGCVLDLLQGDNEQLGLLKAIVARDQ